MQISNMNFCCYIYIIIIVSSITVNDFAYALYSAFLLLHEQKQI